MGLMNFEYNNIEHVEELWRQYFENPTSKITAELVSAYEPLVKKMVGVFLKKKPPGLDYDDLFQAGRMGLMDAITKFNPNSGASFKTYASIRVRGSILDEINSMDWTPRSVRQNIRSVIKSIEKFNGQTKTNHEMVSLIAEDTDFSEDSIETIVLQMNKTHMVSVEPESFEFLSPTVDLTDHEFIIWLTMVINENFNETEKVFIILKYFQELDNKSLMKELDCSYADLNSLRKIVLYKFSVIFGKPNPFDEIPEGVDWGSENENEEHVEVSDEQLEGEKILHALQNTNFDEEVKISPSVLSFLRSTKPHSDESDIKIRPTVKKKNKPKNTDNS